MSMPKPYVYIETVTDIVEEILQLEAEVNCSHENGALCVCNSGNCTCSSPECKPVLCKLENSSDDVNQTEPGSVTEYPQGVHIDESLYDISVFDSGEAFALAGTLSAEDKSSTVVYYTPGQCSSVKQPKVVSDWGETVTLTAEVNNSREAIYPSGQYSCVAEQSNVSNDCSPRVTITSETNSVAVTSSRGQCNFVEKPEDYDEHGSTQIVAPIAETSSRKVVRSTRQRTRAEKPEVINDSGESGTITSGNYFELASSAERCNYVQQPKEINEHTSGQTDNRTSEASKLEVVSPAKQPLKYTSSEFTITESSSVLESAISHAGDGELSFEHSPDTNESPPALRQIATRRTEVRNRKVVSPTEQLLKCKSSKFTASSSVLGSARSAAETDSEGELPFENSPDTDDSPPASPRLQIRLTRVDDDKDRFARWTGQCTRPLPHSRSSDSRSAAHPGETPFRCAVEGCGESFASASILRKHVKTHPEDSPLLCDVVGCGKVLCSTRTLNNHKKTHTGDKPYTCEECTDRFKSSWGLSCHRKRLHLKERPYACEVEGCQQSFLLKFELENHKAKHSVERPFTCAFAGCDKSFRTKATLTYHQRTHVKPEERFLKCPQHGCDKAFYASASLKNHIRTHTGEKPYKCDQCENSFRALWGLTSHRKRIHLNERPYACEVEGCQKSFLSKAELENHKATHSDERPYSCDFARCEKSFKTEATLKYHQRTHVKERPLKCPQDGCGKAFYARDSLKRHIRTHTGETPYPCPKCRRSFKTKWNLTLHTNKLHGKEKPYESDSDTDGSDHSDFAENDCDDDTSPHVDTKRLNCDSFECDKTFSTAAALGCHKHTHAEKIPPNKLHTKETRPPTRQWIRRDGASSSATMINTHSGIAAHVKEKPYACDTAGSEQSDFAENDCDDDINTSPHVDKKRFVCGFSGCDKSFFTAAALGCHKRAHAEKKKPNQLQVKEKPCEDDSNSAGSDQSDSAENGCDDDTSPHIYRKRLSCDSFGCDKTFSTATALRCHKRTHAEKRPPKKLHTKEKPYESDSDSAGSDQSDFADNDDDDDDTSPHINKKRLSCDSFGCHKTFSTAAALGCHKRTHAEKRPPKKLHTKEKPYESDNDSAGSDQSDFADNDDDTSPQVDKKRLDCGFSGCNKSFTTAAALGCHKRAHAEKRPAKRQLKRRDGSSSSTKSIQNHSGMTAAEESCTCDLCGMSLKTRLNLSLHVRRVHLNERSYVCDIAGCGKSFFLKLQLQNHIAQHLNKRPFQCHHDGCGKSFTTANMLRLHQLIHGERPLKCSFQGCAKAFYAKGCLKRHIRTHTKERPYTCNECQNTFRTAFHLSVHVKIQHLNQKPYVCDVAGWGKTFGLKQNMKNHTASHSRGKADARPYKCSHCDSAFRRYDSLILHTKRLHLSDESYALNVADCSKADALETLKQTVRSKERRLKCSVEGCDKAFYSRNSLTRHERTHTGEKPYKCEDCGRAMTTSWYLQMHRKSMHLNDRQYECKEAGCHKSFVSMPVLENHMLTHSNERPYKCDFPDCDAACKTYYALSQHKIKHTTERQHKCSFPGCNKTYKKRSVLKRHEKRHTGTQFQCAYCGDTFTSSFGLDGHTKRFHVKEWSFACEKPGCGRTFVTRGEFETHKAMHSGLRPFECDFPDCSKRFASPSYLKLHKKTHVKEKTLKCTFEGCAKMCYSMRSLARHAATHTGEKPYHCNECGQAFAQSGNLNGHKRRVHKWESRAFVCEVAGCGKGFPSAHALHIHVAVHQKGRIKSSEKVVKRRGKYANRSNASASKKTAVSQTAEPVPSDIADCRERSQDSNEPQSYMTATHEKDTTHDNATVHDNASAHANDTAHAKDTAPAPDTAPARDTAHAKDTAPAQNRARANDTTHAQETAHAQETTDANDTPYAEETAHSNDTTHAAETTLVHTVEQLYDTSSHAELETDTSIVNMQQDSSISPRTVQDKREDEGEGKEDIFEDETFDAYDLASDSDDGNALDLPWSGDEAKEEADTVASSDCPRDDAGEQTPQTKNTDFVFLQKKDVEVEAEGGMNVASLKEVDAEKGACNSTTNHIERKETDEACNSKKKKDDNGQSLADREESKHKETQEKNIEEEDAYSSVGGEGNTDKDLQQKNPEKEEEEHIAVDKEDNVRGMNNAYQCMVQGCGMSFQHQAAIKYHMATHTHTDKHRNVTSMQGRQADKHTCLPNKQRGLTNKHGSQADKHKSLTDKHTGLTNKQTSSTNKHGSQVDKHVSLADEHTGLTDRQRSLAKKHGSHTNNQSNPTNQHEILTNNPRSLTKKHRSLTKKHRSRAKKRYVCPIPECGKSFSFTGGLTYHRRRHHAPGPLPYICSKPGCWRGFFSQAGLTLHLALNPHTQKTAPRKTYACAVPGCGKVFTQAGSLSLHKDVHLETRPRRYKCDVPGCDKAYFCHGSLQKHKNKHNGERPYMCEACGKDFRCPSTLRAHRLRFHANIKYSCTVPGCGKVYRQSWGLMMHSRRNHGVGDKPPTADQRPKKARPTEKNFKCDVLGCDKAYFDSGSLKTHRMTHFGEKPFVCQEPGCAAAFITAAKLRIHGAVHTKVRFHCKVAGCGRNFTQLGVLQSHVRHEHCDGAIPAHLKEKTYKCGVPGCSKVYGKKRALGGHMKKHNKTA